MSGVRKVCVVTGSRSEYGILYWLMRSIQDAHDLDLQLLVTGMHLSPEFGLTYRQIEKDGFPISYKVETLLSSDTPIGSSKSIGLGIGGIAEAYDALQPDIVVLLGDRYEIFAAAIAALLASLPIAHIHGGENTEGAFDEAIRHSISKMSHLHFTANEAYQNRVIQLGEHPERVFNVGALGLENIRRLQLVDKAELVQAFGLELEPRSLLVAWHPVTLEQVKPGQDFQVVLEALSELIDTNLIFTKSNADTGGRIINKIIDDYVQDHPENSVAYTSLGQIRYLSTLKYVDGIVGNSSSGIIEAPSLETGTVNIGDRQRGRARAASVIDCKLDSGRIKEAIAQIFDLDYKKKLESVVNPYGDGDTAGRIAKILKSHSLHNLLKKTFFDLPI